jgi:hypothetical protein
VPITVAARPATRHDEGVPWPRYVPVRFTTRDYEADGAALGSKGYIIEVYDDAYEVEVSDPKTGESLFIGAVPERHLELLDEA